LIINKSHEVHKNILSVEPQSIFSKLLSFHSKLFFSLLLEIKHFIIESASKNHGSPTKRNKIIKKIEESNLEDNVLF